MTGRAGGMRSLHFSIGPRESEAEMDSRPPDVNPVLVFGRLLRDNKVVEEKLKLLHLDEQGLHGNLQVIHQKDTRRILDPSKASPTITDFGSRHSRGFIVPLAVNKPAPTIVGCLRCNANGGGIVLPDGRERVLQFTEAAALQGFPPDYVFVASQSRAWKMVAQAIQIDLGRAILEGIVAEAGLCVLSEPA